MLVPHNKKYRYKFTNELKQFENDLEIIEKTKVFMKVSQQRLKQYKKKILCVIINSN